MSFDKIVGRGLSGRTYPKPAPKDVAPAKAVKRKPLSLLPCTNEGSTAEGATCGCASKAVYWCEHPEAEWDRCVRSGSNNPEIQSCDRCPLYSVEDPKPQPVADAPQSVRYPAVGLRHLAFHILPVAGTGVWQKAVDQLRLRWGLFTGRKVVAVATGSPIRAQASADERVDRRAETLRLDDFQKVKAYLPADAEVVEVANDPEQWERASWPVLWPPIFDAAGDDDVVLYGHAKGVSRKPDSPTHRWADLLYSLSLDHWPETEALLLRHPVVGSLKKVGFLFPEPSRHSKWHYSGNFWWARVGVLRGRLAAVPVPVDRWAAEAWVGMAYAEDEGGELFGPSDRLLHYYKPEHLNRMVAEYANWLAAHKPAAPPKSPKVPTGSRLSVILPTTGRESLVAAVESLRPQLAAGDELIVKADGSGDWGATPRREAVAQAVGDYLLFIDDDDVYTEGALGAVRKAVAEAPNRVHIFRMQRRSPFNDVLPVGNVVRVGNVSTQMMLVPNDPARLGEWGLRYEGDYDFLTSTLRHYPEGPVWHDEVIAIWRDKD